MLCSFDLMVDTKDSNLFIKNTKEIIQRLMPNWDEASLKYKIYTDGITNKLIGFWTEDFNKQILIRVYGANSELFIDRALEKKNMQVLHKHGYGPKVLASFNNGICYFYTKGKPITYEMVVTDNLWKAIAKKMAAVHKIKDGADKYPAIFNQMRSFLKFFPDEFQRFEDQKRVRELEVTRNYLIEEVHELEKEIQILNCPVVFSHNDILLANIIWDEVEQDVTFIDVEYSGPNFQPFDIANHFNEFAGTDNVDYSKFPSPEFQYQWLNTYLTEYFEKEISSDIIQKWYIWVNKFTLVSHLLWASWAFVQAHHSNIDFDFIEYGIIRLNEYRRNKIKKLNIDASTLP